MAKKTQPHGKSLVIVESPAKAKTINKYLGRDYVVMASLGHVCDLPDREFGIDIENDFSPTYEIVDSRKKTLYTLREAAKNSDFVYLATDLDREGEAIAWHLAETLALKPQKTRRVVFNEITKSAIRAAFAHPRKINMHKVLAQQARRILDRIVGYQLSPLLWQKIAKGLSAGRVQSVAVRLIVEREWAIRDFVPTESWRIQAVFTPDMTGRDRLAEAWSEFLSGDSELDDGRSIKERNAWVSEYGCVAAELVTVGGEPFKPAEHTEALKIAEHLGFVCEQVDQRDWEEYKAHGIKMIDLVGKLVVNGEPAFTVSDVQTRRLSSKPPRPFTTATLQQAASTHMGFSALRTMGLAQALYEGVDIGNGKGPVGLITYMRTDSTQLSGESVKAIRKLIHDTYGDKYLPGEPVIYGAKRKHAQEAHEAIRPSDVRLTPEQLKDRLPSEQWRLYDLIWRRTVACQMKPAQWDSTVLLIEAPTPLGAAVFKATGRQLVFDGYQRVATQKRSEDFILPPLKVNTPVAPLDIDPEQQFTSPPPRYSEASLVKEMEGEGIGRPSTYASIIQTIQDRGYVEQVDRRFLATDKGQIVTEKLIEHFPDIMNVKFTSHMEDELDKIEEAHLDWLTVMREFYGPFKKALERAAIEMKPARSEPSEFKCPKCDKEMVYRWARTGRFLSCSGYPECKGAYNVDREGKPIEPTQVDTRCELCDEPMILRQSRHGFFLGCSKYPECTHTVPCAESGEPLKLVRDEELEGPCDTCGEGRMQVKRAGFRVFLGCNRYPKCRNTSKLPEGVRVERKTQPVEEAGFCCERCGAPMRIKSGRRGRFIACSGFPKCRNTKPIEKLEEMRKLAAEGKNPVAPSGEDAEHGSDAATGEAKSNGSKKAARRPIRKTGSGKVDLESLGPPPPGFAWTRTGKPVVEEFPDGELRCPECGAALVMRRGRFGPFFSCTGYPKCKCSVNLRGEAKKQAELEMPAPVRPKPVPTEIECEECGEKMLIRVGRSGRFLGCGGFPKCKATRPLPEELNDAAVATEKQT